MKGSYQIGTAFGIPIGVHWSFLFVVALFWGHPWALVALFGSVLLHELGHSLVARRYGVRVLDITLWPLGGVARLATIPESSRIEAWVALAGPAVNVVLAAFAFCALVLSVLLVPALAPAFQTLWWVNLSLGAFNLLPAFPMDGGRVLRAWLARRRSWVDATELAVRIGRWVAVAMILWPILSRGLPPVLRLGWTMPLIGMFVLLAGFQELVAVRLRHGIGPLGGQVGGNGFARAERAAEPARREPSQPEEHAGETNGARRPAHWDGSASGVGRNGWDDEQLEALERFRGRLRDPGQEA